jgi:hypothetical protein
MLHRNVASSVNNISRVFSAANLASIRQNVARFNLVKCSRSLAERPREPLFLRYTEEDNALGDLFIIAGKSLVASRRSQCGTF